MEMSFSGVFVPWMKMESLFSSNHGTFYVFFVKPFPKGKQENPGLKRNCSRRQTGTSPPFREGAPSSDHCGVRFNLWLQYSEVLAKTPLTMVLLSRWYSSLDFHKNGELPCLGLKCQKEGMISDSGEEGGIEVTKVCTSISRFPTSFRLD